MPLITEPSWVGTALVCGPIIAPPTSSGFISDSAIAPALDVLVLGALVGPPDDLLVLR
jgi:hypothetical protein